jgi:predicted nucleic acid-binding protein
VYFDTSYIAKFYFNEPESARIRTLVRRRIHYFRRCGLTLNSTRCFIGACARVPAPPPTRDLASLFSEHMEDGLWNLIPVSEGLLRRTSARLISSPRDLFIRTADAVHLTTASEIGERDVWASDRQMLAAAPYFGLAGRSV